VKILVLQTARIGDTIQTTSLFRQIRTKYPDAHITVMIRAMSEEVIKANPDVNDYIIYHEDPIFSDMISRDSDRYMNAYKEVEKLILDLRQRNFDIAYNITHSTSSALLLKLAQIPKVIGAHLSEDWQFTLRGPWTVYFFTSVLSRDYNDLNLCDIFKLYEPIPEPVKELVFDVNSNAMEFTDNLFAEYHIAPEDFVVCMQLGASEANKRWPAEYFAQLGKKLHEKYKARIFLVGVPSEAELGQKFQREVPGLAIPLFGKTTIPQLAALLKRSHLLVTNDTGTMHLAAAVKCPVMLVSVGYVHFRETGPYGIGNCAIELRDRSFKMDISSKSSEIHPLDRIQPEQVLKAIDWLFSMREKKQLIQHELTPDMDNVNVHISEFAPDGCLQFYPVIRRGIDEKDFLRFAYRLMWLEHLNVNPNKQTEIENLHKLFRFYNAPDTKTLTVWNKEFRGSFEELAGKYKQGIHITEQLKNTIADGKIMRAREQVKLLSEIDEQIRIYGELNSYLKPITLVTKFERDNLEGSNPLELAKQTLNIYRGGYERSTLMAKKVKRCCDYLQNTENSTFE